MLLNSIAFIAGICLLQLCPDLPAGFYCLLPFLALPLLRWRVLHLPVLMVIGFLWAAWRAEMALTPQLDARLEAQTILVEGNVVDIPVRTASGILRLRLFVERINDGSGWRDFNGLTRLGWYESRIQPGPGERWQLAVRLKRPHGFANPGGFDYERWLFQQRIRATGYVREDERNRRLSDLHSGLITRAREQLRSAMETMQAEYPAMGLIRALVMGDRSAIRPPDWNILNHTGTSHLMAISGLHISLVAGMLFWLGRVLWVRAGRLAEVIPARKAAAIFALTGAVLYALFSGFGIPARRALIMVTVFMLALVFNRRTTPGTALGTAAVATLLIDPLSVLSVGWWLSFWAVALIAYLLTGRHGRRGIGGRWIYMHVCLAVGMLPVLLVFFQSASLVAPLANVVAVPWVSLLVVPLSLLGTIVFFVHAASGKVLLAVAAGLLEILWHGLSWLADTSFAVWQQHRPFLWTLPPGMLGLMLLFIPRGLPGRWLGLLLLLPVFVVQPERPAQAEVYMALLDVGQGLAAVVETRHHVLVYDTGPRFSEAFDTGAAVVIPYLRTRGIRHIDTLIVSHGDNDHIGGTESLLSAYRPEQVLSSDPEKIPLPGAAYCRRGQRWEWDGVQFEMLYPDTIAGPLGNNSSCVLKIHTRNGQGVLFTGDIERAAEQRLLREQAGMLQADVLVVPHHGSGTSSSAEFVKQVAPVVALIPAGYLNRYRFPKPDVVERYARNGTMWYQTGRTGAITVHLGPGRKEPEIEFYRQQVRHYWMQPFSCLALGLNKV